MKNIRSFIAIQLAADVNRNSTRMLKRLRQSNDGIKWVPADNLHLTLKFLGDVDNTEVPAVCNVDPQGPAPTTSLSISILAAPVDFQVLSVPVFYTRGSTMHRGHSPKSYLN